MVLSRQSVGFLLLHHQFNLNETRYNETKWHGSLAVGQLHAGGGIPMRCIYLDDRST